MYLNSGIANDGFVGRLVNDYPLNPGVNMLHVGHQCITVLTPVSCQLRERKTNTMTENASLINFALNVN